jgi:hypothetical protein
VRGSRMPRADELPDDLKDMAYRNAVELTHARWKSDIQLLIRALRPYMGAPVEEQQAQEAQVPPVPPEPTSTRQVATRRMETASIENAIDALTLDVSAGNWPPFWGRSQMSLSGERRNGVPHWMSYARRWLERSCPLRTGHGFSDPVEAKAAALSSKTPNQATNDAPWVRSRSRPDERLGARWKRPRQWA